MSLRQQKLQASPETLSEVVLLGVTQCHGRTIVEQFTNLITNFLGQKFIEAADKNPEHEKILSDLFIQCTRSCK